MNASSMCSVCFGFLTPEGYCKKCKRQSDPASVTSKWEEVQQQLVLENSSANVASGSSTSTSKASSQVPPRVNSGTSSANDVSQSELIAAQNRTTHAVRALAVFFFISLRTGVLGSSLVGLGIFLLPNSSWSGFGVFLILAGWATAFIGFFWAVWAGMGELNKSRIY